MKIRVALRHEGDWWNAYLAREGTMNGAKLIGAILFGAVAKDKARKEAFMALMQSILNDAIVEVMGKNVGDWEIKSAPESERSGHS